MIACVQKSGPRAAFFAPAPPPGSGTPPSLAPVALEGEIVFPTFGSFSNGHAFIPFSRKFRIAMSGLSDKV